VLPANEIQDPELRALQDRNMDDLKRLGAAAGAIFKSHRIVILVTRSIPGIFQNGSNDRPAWEAVPSWCDHNHQSS
jgi:hypothetical protein